MARSHSIYIIQIVNILGAKWISAAFTVKHEAVDHIQRCLLLDPGVVIRVDQWRDSGGFVCTKTAEEFITP